MIAITTSNSTKVNAAFRELEIFKLILYSKPPLVILTFPIQLIFPIFKFRPEYFKNSANLANERRLSAAIKGRKK